jgi:hypothetical protein
MTLTSRPQPTSRNSRDGDRLQPPKPESSAPTPLAERIAGIVADEPGVDPEYEYTGGDRGWDGDVQRMQRWRTVRGVPLGSDRIE